MQETLRDVVMNGGVGRQTNEAKNRLQCPKAKWMDDIAEVAGRKWVRIAQDRN